MIYVKNKYHLKLKELKRLTVKKFGRGHSHLWKNKDFEDLSFEINRSTKILISPATLKRIFGKNKSSERYYPQEKTIEALEIYSGYKAPTIKKSNNFLSKAKRILLMIAVSIILAIILFLIKEHQKNEKAPDYAATLSLSKVEGKNPSTAFFNYNIKNSEDSLFLTFGDFPSKDLFLDPEKQLASHFYSHPGLFNAFISNHGEIVSDSVKVFIPSFGWKSFAYYFNQNLGDRYFPVSIDKAKKSGIFHPTKNDLSAAGIDTTQIITLRLDNFKRTNQDGDNFVFKTKLKNVSYWPAVRCYSAYISIIGENGKIMFKLVNQGCSFHSEYNLSEKYVKGSSKDLSQFSINMSNWTEIEIENIDKNVMVQINSQKIFSDTYYKTIGNIMGLSLQFHGSGFVDFIELKNFENEIIFSEDFD